MRTPFLLVLVLTLLVPAVQAGEEGAPDLTSPAGIRKALEHRDGAVRLQAAQVAAGVQDHVLTAPLVARLTDRERAVRMAAIRALGHRTVEKEQKAAALGLARRLPAFRKEGADVEEHLALVQALHDLAQPATIKALLDFPVTTDRRIVKARTMAVANVPAAEAIDRLILFGSRGRRSSGYRKITRDALRYATGENLTTNPDKWRDWWRKAKKDFDFEAAARRREEERRRAQAKEEKKREKKKGGKKGKKKSDDDGEDEPI